MHLPIPIYQYITPSNNAILNRTMDMIARAKGTEMNDLSNIWSIEGKRLAYEVIRR